MTQTRKKLVFSWVLILAMVISVISPGSMAVVNAENKGYKETLSAATKCLHDNLEPVFGSEWTVIQQARQESPDKKWLHFYNYNITDYLSDEANVNAMSASDAVRVILALEAIGDNPTDVKGVNLFGKLADFTQFDNKYSSIYDVPVMAYILMAAKDYDDNVFHVAGVETENQTTKEKLKNKILSYYDEEKKCWGGPDWNTGVWTPDPDITAQALQGLSVVDDSTINDVINNSLESLKKLIDENGCVLSYGYPSACSTAQVICAYAALGIDPDQKKENEKSLIDGLCSYFDETTGGILDYTGTKIDLQFNTVQAGYALVAYERYNTKKEFIFAISKLEKPVYSCDGEHSFGTEKEIIRNATCTEDGVAATGVCTICGQTNGSDTLETILALGHTGGTATCSELAKCTRCGQEYGELNPTNHTGITSTKNAKEATCTAAGYTGDKVCDGCGEVLEKGTEIAKKAHTPVEIPAVAATETTPGKTAGKKCSVCGEILEEPKEVPATGKTGNTEDKTEEKTVFETEYKVTGKKNTNVEYTGTSNASAKSIVIPATVTDTKTNKKYKVTKVAAGALKNNKTVTSVTVGKNVTEIGKNAFNGCKKAKTFKIYGNKLTKVGKNAFKNIKKNAKIIIYAKNKKTYNKVKNLIKKSGAKNVKYQYKNKK